MRLKARNRLTSRNSNSKLMLIKASNLFLLTANLERYRRKSMLPLTFASIDDECIIGKINGNPEVKKHLENLGFVQGGTVSVISKTDGNLIVNVKGARVALNKDMASKIMV